ncbi:MAG: GNAT family N-acetyltransferase [Armatimonadetes bacterium]|nr:GNAT family N-acetyltransferase [Armatimonadota bacterium]
MTVTSCAYHSERDFDRVHAFLTSLYRPRHVDGQWFAPIFEYGVTHPFFDGAHAHRFRLWYAGDRLVALACYELYLGEAFFAVAPGCDDLFGAMLDHAEAHLAKAEPDGRRVLNAFVTDRQPAWLTQVAGRGYERSPHDDRPMSVFDIPRPFPAIALPDGFRLLTLAEDNDLAKLNRVLHRGFGHGDEPDEGTAEMRLAMQRGPHYRRDLQVAVQAPDGQWVAFAGMWYDETNRFGYVEPVCTDPDYRRLGLGRAAVLDGIRRCGELGAEVAYVGTTMPFYLSFGFQPLGRQECWRRVW